MNTLDLPSFTLAHLLQHGSAIDLSPMEPQPPEGEWYQFNVLDEHNTAHVLVMHEKYPSKRHWEIKVPMWPGDVVALSDEHGWVHGSDGRIVHARCESVTPLRLADLTGDQIRETGEPEIESHYRIVPAEYRKDAGSSYVKVLDCSGDSTPLMEMLANCSWCWATRWVLEKST